MDPGALKARKGSTAASSQGRLNERTLERKEGEWKIDIEPTRTQKIELEREKGLEKVEKKAKEKPCREKERKG